MILSELTVCLSDLGLGECSHALSGVKTAQPAVTRRSGLAGVIDEEEITDQRVPLAIITHMRVICTVRESVNSPSTC